MSFEQPCWRLQAVAGLGHPCPIAVLMLMIKVGRKR